MKKGQELNLDLLYFIILNLYDNVFRNECQNANMHKNKYKNLDKIPYCIFEEENI